MKKVIQITAAGNFLYRLYDDGSVTVQYVTSAPESEKQL